jgi:uncharacterized protein YggE
MRTFLLLLASTLSASVLADGLPSSPYIQVAGRGELQVAPDMAYVSLSIDKVSLDAKAARADVETRTAKVLEAARKAGIPDKDIDAPSVSVSPEFGCDSSGLSSMSSGCERKLTGQHVSRSVTLTLRDLSRYGELVDGLFRAGITDLGDPQLDRSDRRALEQKARALAVTDAHDKAAGLAQSAGVTLGSVYSIAEQGGSYGPRPAMRMAAMSSVAPTPEYLNGKIEISADVTVFYLINK